MPFVLPLNPSYHAYTRGCEAADEQSLELIYTLSSYYDEQYPGELLAFVLRDLNPRVLLQTDETTGRRDCPWLSDEVLDTVDNKCRQSLGLATPAHQAALDAMLFELSSQGLAAAAQTSSGASSIPLDS